MTIYLNDYAAGVGFYYSIVYSAYFAFYNTATTRIDVYKGTMPTDCWANGWTRANHSSDLLLTWTNLAFHTTSLTGRTPYTYLETFPAAATAVADGTATWASVYKNGSESTYFVIGPVDVPSGSPATANGLVILPTLSITNGVAYDIIDAAIALKHLPD